MLSFLSSAHVVRLELNQQDKEREADYSGHLSQLSGPGPSLTQPGREKGQTDGW